MSFSAPVPPTGNEASTATYNKEVERTLDQFKSKFMSAGSTIGQQKLLFEENQRSHGLLKVVPDMFGVIAQSSVKFNTPINDMVIWQNIKQPHLPALVTCTPAHSEQLRASRQWRAHPFFIISPDSNIDKSIFAENYNPHDSSVDMEALRDQYCSCFDVFSTCTYWDIRAAEEDAAAMQIVVSQAVISLPSPTLFTQLITISDTFTHIRDIVVMAEQGGAEFKPFLEWDRPSQIWEVKMNDLYINFCLDYIYCQSLSVADLTAKFTTQDTVMTCKERRRRARQWKINKESISGDGKCSNVEFAHYLFKSSPMLTIIQQAAPLISVSVSVAP